MKNMKQLKIQKPILTKLQIMMLIACANTTANANESDASEHQETAAPDLSAVISTDGFANTDSQGKALQGNGTGDLVLVVYDPSGTSPRKKSFLLDLSFEDNDGSTNDLNLSGISKIKDQITISNSKLSTFIESSKSRDDMIWQVFAIANQYNSGNHFGDVNLINFGLATTELNERLTPLTHQELHQSKIHRANLIHNNIVYGISSNSSLVSFTGEPSAFDMRIHNTLADGMQATGKLDQTLTFGIHKLKMNKDKASQGSAFFTTYDRLGTFEITQPSLEKNWQLIFSKN